MHIAYKKRNLLLNRPLLFGDPQQLAIIQQHRRKSAGVLPVAIARVTNAPVPQPLFDEVLKLDFEQVKFYHYYFDCINARCWKQNAGVIDERSLTIQDNLLSCPVCTAHYRLEENGFIYLVPETII